jgi:hypothetical protein
LPGGSAASNPTAQLSLAGSNNGSNPPLARCQRPHLLNARLGLLLAQGHAPARKTQLAIPHTELFNILNRANFNTPNAVAFTPSGVSPTAGVITSTSTASRQIQFGLKLVW